MSTTNTQAGKYTAQYFIDKFKAIPEERWCVNSFHKGDRSCALGHCGWGKGRLTSEGASLRGLFISCCKGGVTCVNDNFVSHYQQPTPRQRVLAALIDIRSKTNNKENHDDSNEQ